MSSRLTFGVEFEFALALLGEGQADPDPELPQAAALLPKVNSDRTYSTLSGRVKNRVFDLIAKRMVAAGLPARSMPVEISPDNSPRSSPDGFQDDGIGWIPSRQRRLGSISPVQRLGQDVENTNENEDRIASDQRTSTASVDEFGSEWMVTEDWSICETKSLNYVWYPIEVQSPPYIFCEDSLQAVILACNVITSQFRLETNSTTGLHVHVGDGADGYALQTLKKLMAFLWIFEPQMDQLHPNRRARLLNNERATWYESLRRGSILCQQASLDGTFPMKILDGLKIIFEAGNIHDLNSWVKSGERKSAYQIDHLTYQDTMKKTVEFRQHEGTMDGTRAVEWIKTVVVLMEFIMDVDTTVLMDFLLEAAAFEDRCWSEEEKPAYDIIDLFNDIGLEDQATYWDQALPKSTRNKPTKYHHPHPRKRPMRPMRPSSTPDNQTRARGEVVNDHDQRDLDRGMLRASGPVTPPRQTAPRTSADWTRHFLGPGS